MVTKGVDRLRGYDDDPWMVSSEECVHVGVSGVVGVTQRRGCGVSGVVGVAKGRGCVRANYRG